MLLCLLALNVLKGVLGSSEPERAACEEKVFVQISGDITRPGVYAFPKQPELKDLLARAGRLLPRMEKYLSLTGASYHSGTDVVLRSHGREVHVFEGEMSAFYKITLEVPISLNRETLEGLTAIPRIGPRIAGAIIRARDKRGGFRRLDEILSVTGIGNKLYRKISPYLVL